jgi:hypothetical protein
MKKAQAKKTKKAKKVTAKNVRKTDLGAIFDAHVRHEFVDHDVAATMKTMATEPYVHNVPTLTGRRRRRFLHAPLRRQDACRYAHRADLAHGGQ